MTITFSVDLEKNSVEILTDIKDPIIYSALLSSLMYEIRPFLARNYGIDNDIIEPCMINIKNAANLACAGLDDNSYIEEFINYSIERRKKIDTKGATDVSI